MAHITLPKLLAVSLISSLLQMYGADYFPPPDSAGGWRSLKNAGEIRKIAGMSPTRLDQAFEFAQRTSKHGGLVVVRHGYVVYEKYYGKANRESNPNMASIGKMFTSVAWGILLKEKPDLFPDGLDQKVITEKFIPEAFPLDDPLKADIKLGQLLSMSAGLHGEGGNPGFVNGQTQALAPLPAPAPGSGQPFDIDMAAVHTPLWTKPGGGYSYASTSPHLASIILRHTVGMELQEYLNERLAKPMGWGPWGYVVRGPHTPGGGSIALHSTDAMRFGYLLLHHGRWGKQQLVPADYVGICAKPSPYNPHSPYGLMFEVNQDGHVAGAPRDTFFKSGAAGFALYIVPSLDLVIYKLSGSDPQYDAKVNGLPEDYKPSFQYDGSRDSWKPATPTQFHDPQMGGDDGVRRLLEMVVAAVNE
jgi:CubicO group peptidase (beta-lactamase class C family)